MSQKVSQLGVASSGGKFCCSGVAESEMRMASSLNYSYSHREVPAPTHMLHVVPPPCWSHAPCSLAQSPKFATPCSVNAYKG